MAKITDSEEIWKIGKALELSLAKLAEHRAAALRKAAEELETPRVLEVGTHTLELLGFELATARAGAYLAINFRVRSSSSMPERCLVWWGSLTSDTPRLASFFDVLLGPDKTWQVPGVIANGTHNGDLLVAEVRELVLCNRDRLTGAKRVFLGVNWSPLAKVSCP